MMEKETQFLEKHPELVREVEGLSLDGNEQTNTKGNGKAEASEVPESQHLTDVGNSKRLVAKHGQDLRYCHRFRKWYTWNGTRWVKDDSGEVVRRAKQTAAGIYTEAAAATDPAERKALGQWAARSESEARICAMIALAESEPSIPVAPDQLDADPWLLNCVNGVLSLRTGELRPHRREDLLTKQVPVAYDPEARCERWLTFLVEIMDGNPRLVAFLQRAVGYALSGDTSEQSLFFFYGLGANGKSVFLETIKALLGDYSKQADFGTFLTRKHDSPRNDVARLVGARFVSAVEAEPGRHFAESLVKALTGSDTIAARFLYSEAFEFVPQFKLFLAANSKPIIRGTDNAIWRRIRLVPFAVTIPPEEQDKKLPEKLRAELPGILAWAVQGCLTWQKCGLDAPPEVLGATQEYKAEMDVIGLFLGECCIENANVSARASHLYAAYTGWCDTSGERPLSQKAFGARLTERGFRRYRGGTGSYCWAGVGLLAAQEGE